ncbi:P-loop containing nucleoside triphosphate hydrolase protein [Cucurbitaria berberidis CBS 394.84]|uniref:ATP-dependent RNA helicase ROK1 n=1 Tax=Cucurbitaria berberidis CBS 394.84 TaxID=1168544 RepID=A0A9P4GRS6_9PLEO|nr:P-loop containing nucleoside triphosphate hydrolase protein [Cucurbitaria berberidis CBS 394.84]KAF1851523.1 P-loop containing nucleoside triphosphate hydrolase protein [Cucurbitaria berberidis CBS 394.84]
MNVFKLLSRSSKAAPNSPSQKLPSSGAVANPQLFGHDEPAQPTQSTNKSRKRKRGLVAVTIQSPPSPAALPADLDFFGGSAGVDTELDGDDGKLTKGKKRQRKEELKDSGALENGTDVVEEEQYDVDECKKILHLHKLKIAVLEDFAPQVEESREEKKKSKKRKKEKEQKNQKKEAKRQLYPQPLTSFAHLRTRYGISRRLAENIMDQGYKLPTEVQLGALPLLLASNNHKAGQNGSTTGAESLSGEGYAGDIDLLTVAPTGSGKTIAFLIPIINALLSESKDTDSRDGPRAIVLAPTRELASQIVNEARKMAKGTAIKATLMRKGMEVVERTESELIEYGPDSPDASEHDEDASNSDNEDKAVQKKKQTPRRAELVKAAILVATPLALLNTLKRKDGTIANLPSVSHLVLDEADVLLDPLFREQTLHIWNACTNPKLRVGLWSATMGSNIENLTLSTMNTRWETLSSSKSDMPARPPLIRLVVGLKDSAIPNISHQLTYAATEQGKLLGIRQLLHPTSSSSDSTAQSTLRPPFLVFTQTISRAIALHSELLYDIPPEAGGSSRIAVLHADLSSSARDSIMTRFRRGEVWVLITTDLLARGVDFRGLNGVVNYDVPNSAAAYVHRVGRTGRAGREGGVAVTFYTQDDIPYVKLIANIIRASEKLRGVKAEDGSIKQWLIDALPTPTKRDRQQLKKRGVEARRTVKGADNKSKNRISTKSGYERKIENNRRGAMLGSKRRAEAENGGGVKEVEDGSDGSDFEGFE